MRHGFTATGLLLSVIAVVLLSSAVQAEPSTRPDVTVLYALDNVSLGGGIPGRLTIADGALRFKAATGALTWEIDLRAVEAIRVEPATIIDGAIVRGIAITSREDGAAVTRWLAAADENRRLMQPTVLSGLLHQSWQQAVRSNAAAVARRQ